MDSSRKKSSPPDAWKTLDSVPLAIIWHNTRKIVFCNKAAVKLLFVKNREQPRVIELNRFIEKNYHKKTSTSFGQILKKKTKVSIEVALLNSKKETVKTTFTSIVIKHEGKKIIQSVIQIKEDKAKNKIDGENTSYTLQKISADSLDVIFHFDFSNGNRLKYISDSAKYVLGYSPTEIYKNTGKILKRVLDEDREKINFIKKGFFKKQLQKNKVKEIIRFRHKNGSIKHLEVRVSPALLGLKKITAIIGDLRDVTEREETQALLVETKEKFDIITNYGNDIIAFYTFLPREKYLYVSPNIEKILGYKVKDVISDRRFFENKIISDKDLYNETDKQLKKHQRENKVKKFSYSFKIHKKNGGEIWLENNLIPITNAAKKIVFYINIIHDITAGKQTQLETQMQYINYRNLLDNSPVAYIIHECGICQYLNNAFLSMLKLKDKNQVLGRPITSFLGEEQKDRANQLISSIYSGNKQEEKIFSSFTIKGASGNTLEQEVKSVKITFNDRECILSLVNNLSEQRQREQEKQKMISVELSNAMLQKEIREREEIQKSLTEKTAHLSSIFESSNHLHWTVNREYKIVSFNKNYSEVVKYLYDINVQTGINIEQHLAPDIAENYIDFWHTRYASAFKGNKLEFEKSDEFAHRHIFRKVFINPIYNDKREITELSCLAHEITDSKIYEQKLLNQTAKLTAIFDSSHHYIWTIDRNEKLTSFNKNYYDLVTTLYNTKPYVGLVLDRGVLANDKEYTMLLKYHYNRAFNGIATSFEIETRDQELKNVYLEIFLNPIYENNTVVEVSGIAHNITEKKHVQQRMELSLKEKEILLREVHHRVKNNMQVISSILNLQSSYVSDEYALTLLKESQNRIKTMAHIHESLYQNKSFTSVNFSDYVNTLVNNIVQSYAYSSDKINLEINLEPITLSLDSSIPAGLIINELITNAIKHAFPGKRQGTIFFNLRCENNLVILELKDNGVGFAEGLDFENSHSLGLQLVNTLTEQIDGKIKFKSELNVGTEVVVTFNK